MVRHTNLLQRVCLVAALAASSLSTSSCGKETPPGSSNESVLIVIPQDTKEAMFGSVSGTVSVNDQGCFTMDDRVLVVGNGSRVAENGDAIDVADVGIVEVGSRASGSGGYIDGAEEVRHYAESVELDSAAMTCQSDPDNPSLAVLDPASS